jgi:hypothetical protein
MDNTSAARAAWDVAGRRVKTAGEAWRRMHDAMRRHPRYFEDPPAAAVARMRVRADRVWAEYLRRQREEYEPARLAYDAAVCAARGIGAAQLEAERCALAEEIVAALKAEGRW